MAQKKKTTKPSTVEKVSVHPESDDLPLHIWSHTGTDNVTYWFVSAKEHTKQVIMSHGWRDPATGVRLPHFQSEESAQAFIEYELKCPRLFRWLLRKI